MALNEDRRDRWGEVSLPGDAMLRVGQLKSASALEPRCASTQALLASGRRAMHACFAHIGYLDDGTEEYLPYVIYQSIAVAMLRVLLHVKLL